MTSARRYFVIFLDTPAESRKACASNVSFCFDVMTNGSYCGTASASLASRPCPPPTTMYLVGRCVDARLRGRVACRWAPVGILDVDLSDRHSHIEAPLEPDRQSGASGPLDFLALRRQDHRGARAATNDGSLRRPAFAAQ